MDSFGLGLLCALMAVFSFGTYMIPLKRHADLNSQVFLMHMALGAFVSSIGAALWVGWQPFYWTGFFCGLVWTLGAGSIFRAVQKEEAMGGVTVRAMGTSITVSFLMGTFYFKETVLWHFAIPAWLLMLAGLFVLDPKALRNPLRNWRSYLAGFVFGSYLAPWDPAIHGIARFMFPLTLGIVVGSAFWFAKSYIASEPSQKNHKYKKYFFENAGMGVLWTAGSIACYTSVDLLGFTIGYPLSQLNLLVAIAWGVLAFGEYPTRTERVRVLTSGVGMVIGAFLLSMARGAS